MGDTLTLAFGRVGRFLSQHYWNFEVLHGLDTNGHPLEHALSCFYDTASGAVPRFISVDYKDNYGPLPWKGVNNMVNKTAVEELYGITEPDQIIDSHAELSLYHQYVKDPNHERGRSLYTEAGVRFFDAWKQFNKPSSSKAASTGIPGISDVRIDFQEPDRFASDFATPYSTSPFALELPRASLNLSDLPFDYFTDMSIIGNTRAIMSSIYDMTMKQLERCDRLDCLVMLLASDTHWGAALTDILDEILPEIPRTSAFLYDITDYKAPTETSSLIGLNPVIVPKSRKCSQLLLWKDISDRISSCALLPLSYPSASSSFHGTSTSGTDVDTLMSTANALRTDKHVSLTDISAVMSLSIYGFLRQARAQTYRLSSVVDGLVPVSHANILSTGLNISLTGGFYNHMLDLSGLEVPHFQNPIDASFSAARSFCIDPLDISTKHRGWVNPYVEQYAEFFRQPIIRNNRGILLRGSVLQLPIIFPHIFNQLYGLSYRTELPIVTELRNTPYYYANLRTIENLIQGKSSLLADKLEIEDALQYLSALKVVYKPSRGLGGMEIDDDQSSSGY